MDSVHTGQEGLLPFRRIMFPTTDGPWIREGRVNVSGNDVLQLVNLAEAMRQKGQTGTEQYGIVMQILHHMVKYAEEREAKVQHLNNMARTEETSTGIFTDQQYERLEMQMNSLRSLLAKQPGITAQINWAEPSIKLSEADKDPCSGLTDIMEAQFFPSEIDFATLQIENKNQYQQQLNERRAAVKASIESYSGKGLPVPLALQLEKRRLSKETLQLQAKLRHEVVQSIDKGSIIKGDFRQPATVEAHQRAREKQNKRNRLKEDRKKKRARKEFLDTICTQHRKEFNAFHRDSKRKARGLAKSVLKYISNQTKAEEERERNANNARLKALREKDEKKYMELLMEAKNERLMSLLKQTEEYMEKIGATIQKEQEASKQLREGLKEEENGNDDDANAMQTVVENTPDGIDMARTRKKYYNIAHRYKEIVTEQPSALVFGKLRSYQMAGLQWLVSLYNNNLNGILADEMGLGKTIQSISLLAYVMEHKKNNGPFLVIAPMSTLHNNWAYELNRWIPSMKAIVYDGSKEVRKRLREEVMATENYNVLLTTFEFAMRDKKYLRKVKWQYIIVDEAHRLKNPKCKLVSDLNEYNKGARRVALSGTPLQNDLPELWSLLNFLHPSIFNSCDNFQQWFSAPLETIGVETKAEIDMNEEEKLLVIDRLHSILRPFVLRREKKEVESQLQDKVDVVLRCTMTPVQRILYNAIDKGEVSMHNRMVQLRKICNHPYLFHPFCRSVPNSYRYLIDNDLISLCSKFRLLDIILPKFKAKNHRVLLFNQMTKSMDIIGQYLQFRGHRYLRLDGTTAAHTRAHNLRLFNAKDSPYFMFILSTKAGGLGLNLQSADTVILFDSDWNPQNDLQAQARAHRIGQRAKVISIRFVTVDTIEEKVLQTANNKRDVEAMVIQAGTFNKDYKAKVANKMMQNVLRKDRDGEVDKVSEVDFINHSIARSEEEYAFYCKMDEDDNFKPPPADKLPVWVWDFVANGTRASNTDQRLVTKEESTKYVHKLEQHRDFSTPDILYGKRKRKAVIRTGANPLQDADISMDTSSEEEEKIVKKKKKKKKTKTSKNSSKNPKNSSKNPSKTPSKTPSKIPSKPPSKTPSKTPSKSPPQPTSELAPQTPQNGDSKTNSQEAQLTKSQTSPDYSRSPDPIALLNPGNKRQSDISPENPAKRTKLE